MKLPSNRSKNNTDELVYFSYTGIINVPEGGGVNTEFGNVCKSILTIHSSLPIPLVPVLPFRTATSHVVRNDSMWSLPDTISQQSTK